MIYWNQFELLADINEINKDEELGKMYKELQTAIESAEKDDYTESEIYESMMSTTYDGFGICELTEDYAKKVFEKTGIIIRPFYLDHDAESISTEDEPGTLKWAIDFEFDENTQRYSGQFISWVLYG